MKDLDRPTVLRRAEAADAKLQEARLARQLTASLRSGNGMCPHCQVPYADHVDAAEIYEHAQAFDRLEAVRHADAPIAMTTADRLKLAVSTATDLLRGRGMPPDDVDALARSLVQHLHLRGLL